MADEKKALSPEEEIFHESVKSGNIEDVQRLLREPGIRVDCLDKSGMTPLQHAAYKGNKNLCELLLAQGANVNSNEHEYSYTALMFAALSGSTETTKVLLDAGARTDHVNSVGRTAAQMAAFTGQHQCVCLINNFISKDVIDYYTQPTGFEKEGKLPKHLVDPVHKMLLLSNLHPVRISLYIRDNKEILNDAVKVARVLDLLCEKHMKQRNTNDIMAVKSHYMACVVRQCDKMLKDKKDNLDYWIKNLLRGREPDGFTEIQERFVRQAIKEFPYATSELLGQIVRSVSPLKIGEFPTALQTLMSAVNGEQFGNDETWCSACGDSGAQKKCSACKMVHYCNQSCQKLHWFTHKKFCKRLLEQFRVLQAASEQELRAKAKQEAEKSKSDEVVKKLEDIKLGADKTGDSASKEPTCQESTSTEQQTNDAEE